VSSSKPKPQYVPPAQAELKPTPILEDASPVSEAVKKRTNRKSLRASYLTDSTPAGSGVTIT
jgi:hypothetical protein